MIRFIALDLDGTLAKPNAPVPVEAIQFIKNIASLGVKIAIVSGKPAAYISGLVRQVGVTDIIIVGENGADIYYSGTFPPRAQTRIGPASSDRDALAALAAHIQTRFTNKVWLQPNTTNVTVFPYAQADIEAIAAEIEEYATASIKGFNLDFLVYKHIDSVEIVPVSVNKGIALRKILTEQNIDKRDAVAVGDGLSDIAMLNEAEHAIGLKLNVPKSHIVNVDSFDEAMRLIQSLLGVDMTETGDRANRDWRIKEYEQLCNDWRSRDLMLWAVLATSIALTGAVAAILSRDDFALTTSNALVVLGLASVYHSVALVKVTKDHLYQWGSYYLIRRLCGAEIDAIHGFDPKSVTNPRIFSENGKWPENVPLPWIYKSVAKSSAAGVFFAVQALLAFSTLGLVAVGFVMRLS